MKKFAVFAAAMLAAIPMLASAGQFDRAQGPALTRSNVTCDGSSVAGFKVLSNPIVRVVDYRHASDCEARVAAGEVIVAPDYVDVFELASATAYLDELGIAYNVKYRAECNIPRIERDKDASQLYCYENDNAAHAVLGARAYTYTNW